MRQIYLRKEFYQLAKKSIAKPSETAKHRQKHLQAWEALRESGKNAREASEAVGISRATLYRWRSRLKAEGWGGLEERSHRPKRIRHRQWSQELIEGIRSLRCLYPGWGKEKIKVLLEEDEIYSSVSTVGRIIGYLKSRKAIPESNYKKRWKAKRRHKRPYAIRKPKDYKAILPGDIIQVDTLDIHPFPGVHFKHFTARDLVSRWDVIEAFPHASSRQAAQFLHSILERLPFRAKAIQVDGGSEFMAEFEQACAQLKIQLFVLPPRSPQLNGRVERAHRTHLDEFYAFHDPLGDLQELNAELRKWEWIYNHIRPHRALDNLSPKKYIDRYHLDLIP